MRPANRSNSSDYYEYILMYTDGTIVLSENAEHVLRHELVRYFTLKEDSIRPPEIYFGDSVIKVHINNGVKCWAFSSSQYVHAVLKKVGEYLNKEND